MQSITPMAVVGINMSVAQALFLVGHLLVERLEILLQNVRGKGRYVWQERLSLSHLQEADGKESGKR